MKVEELKSLLLSEWPSFCLMHPEAISLLDTLAAQQSEIEADGRNLCILTDALADASKKNEALRKEVEALRKDKEALVRAMVKEA